MALRDLHLAELHERARERGVSGYRLLGRDELIEALDKPAGKERPDDKASTPDAERPKRRRGSRGGRGRRGGRAREEGGGAAAQRERGPDRPAEPAEEGEPEQVTGVL